MIHSSYRLESRSTLTWLAVLVFMLIAVATLPMTELSRGIASYLPLHVALEVLSIVMGGMIFAIVWSTQSYVTAGRLLLIGVSALGVSLLDMLHALSYTGMPALVTPSSPDKAIHFWLAARLLMAIALLLCAWVPHRLDPWLNRRSRYVWLGLVLLVVALLTIWLLYFPDSLPSAFIDGKGLTDFKVGAEYALIALYLLAGTGFYRHASHQCVLSAANLAAASVVFAMGEYLLTLYGDVTDVYNLLGHVYKIIGFGFLYRGLFLRLVQQPFQQLKQAQASLQLTIDTLPDKLIEVSRDGTILQVFSEYDKDIVDPKIFHEGINARDVLPGPVARRCMQALRLAESTGSARNVSIEIIGDEQHRYFDLSISRKPQPAGIDATFLVLARETTEQVLQQQRLKTEARANALLLELEQRKQAKGETMYLEMALQGAQSISGSEFAFIHLITHDSNQIPAVISSRSSQGFEHLPEIWEPVVGSRQAVLVNDPKAVAVRISSTHSQVLWRFVSVPVIEAGRVCMVLSVGNKERAYTATDVDVLQRLADSFWRRIKLRRQDAVITRLSTALGQSPYPVLITDTQSRVEYVNEAFTRVSGYEPYEVIGKTPHVLKSGQTPAETYQDMWSKISRGQTWQGELINRRKDGSIYTEKATIYPVRNSAGEVTNYVAHKEDITPLKETEQRIHQLSHYDQMTGLANREVLEGRLKSLLSHGKEADLPVIVLWLDLDNFKAVNDSLGHDAGNLLLVKISNRLRQELGDQVTLSRVSGDAFVALLPHTDQQTAALLARHLLDVIQRPLRINERQLAISGSIGMSIYPGDSASVTGLLMNAETAMYRVKMEGRNGLRFFAQDMQEHSLRALEIASSLKQADMDKEFHMVYQPQLSLHDNTFVGAEALLRWSHPVWGDVSPGEFIPIAEQSGRILEIGTWVLKHVTQQMKTWRLAGLGHFSVAVNLSALQFVQPDLVKNVIEIVTKAGIASNCIEVELTESVALNNPLAAGRAISALRNAGFLVSIDDFGTGYSSMSYLKRFAVDKLKIDQSFIRDLESDADDQAIVTAIIQMAHSLGMKTIAEGVETEAQQAFLQQKNCDAIQGHRYSKPLPAADFEVFVRSHH